ncbi:hypothetical protein [Bacillus thuringiensis]|uniref:Uncharacterized protein n=1 Tax=Bacillus thuringiensis serovar andalousiensis TaxID=257985 RepID=A0A6H0TKY5_BACTU|nr:hypothetical protein [Bacillus thuringiensis]QIW21213.1 hypothetical protein EVG22_23520 [Bacillus thuringiensis serovar andalousiensis]
MLVAVVEVQVPRFVKTPFELGEWVAYECEDYTAFAEVKFLDINPKDGRIKVYGVWGNGSVMNAGDKGYQFADQCRLATEQERYWEERRRVFAKKKRRNNEFHSGDFVSDDTRVLTVGHQDKDTGIVTVLVNNSDETYEIEPQELEILFFAEDMAG